MRHISWAMAIFTGRCRRRRRAGANTRRTAAERRCAAEAGAAGERQRAAKIWSAHDAVRCAGNDATMLAARTLPTHALPARLPPMRRRAARPSSFFSARPVITSPTRAYRRLLPGDICLRQPATVSVVPSRLSEREGQASAATERRCRLMMRFRLFAGFGRGADGCIRR